MITALTSLVIVQTKEKVHKKGSKWHVAQRMSSTHGSHHDDDDDEGDNGDDDATATHGAKIRQTPSM